MNRFQMVITVAAVILFLWFALPSVAIFNIGSVTGMVLSVILFLYGIFYVRIHSFLGSMWQKTAGKIALGCAAFFALAVVVIALIETTLMVKAAVHYPPENTAAVVLGCSVKGERPSRVLSERLKAAYTYLNENEDVICVLSGGQGPGEDLSEAECMYRYLVDKGIDEKRLFMEDASTNTNENLRYSLEILKEQGIDDEITIITSEFHEYRASKAAEKLGITCYSTPSHTFLPYLPTFYIRELYGILYYLLL